MGENSEKQMNKSKKLRTALRSSFTRMFNNLKEEIGKDECNLKDCQGELCLLEAKLEELRSLDKTILEYLLDQEDDTVDLDDEIKSSDEYIRKLNQIRIYIQDRVDNHKFNSNGIDNESVLSQSGSESYKKRFKLPPIEFNKFSGDLKDWLSFWGQFKRIDDDEAIDDVDKFQYLIQATVPSSKARKIVESYPPIGENYNKAVKSLKARFGRDDLLIEVYVRQLLKLVLSNLNNKIVLDNLYDQMESQLRSLETLGVTSDKFSAMLYPLVESCLPEELLRTWQRHSSFDADADLQTRLDALREFLRKEVDNEERITLAVSGFSDKNKSNIISTNRKQTNLSDKTKLYSLENVPTTASDLINHNKFDRSKVKCAFCSSSEHLPEQCDQIKSLPQFDKLKMLSKNGCCFRCTKYGHTSKKCRVRLICSICKGRHVSIMCSNYNADTNNSTGKSGKSAGSENVLVANNVKNEVFLQTLVVQIKGQHKERAVRAIIDTGSQRSYILSKTAIEMEYIPLRKVNLIHNLFGGSNTDAVEHTCYRARLGNLDNSYSCNFEVLDQNVICNNVSHVRQGPWINELQKLGIKLTDTNMGPIEVLIGADVAGKLLTDQRKVLDCGLVAIGTHLGWTLIGKTLSEIEHPNSFISVTTSMFLNDKAITNLWELDTIGIKDPILSSNKAEEELELMKHFNNNVTKNQDGRYEVHMPWIEDHPPLPSNINIARKRLESTVNKLKQKNSFEEYNIVLKDWERENIIEEVPISDNYLNEGHYLPHRPVYKENSTTRVRPVFDASAKEYNQPSLNDCLNKGINLIELIPSIVLRFRLDKIGVISDIKKAFLQISLSETDRDFVRFLWLNENGQLKVYRHTRVVFGVSCSPFLLGAVINHHMNAAKIRSTNSYQTELTEKLQHSFYVDNCITSVSSKEDFYVFIKEASTLFAEAKFELRGWEFSDKNVSSDVPPTPVLGMLWDRRKDTFKINLGNLVCENSINGPVTKRKILSVTHQVFDVLGVSCPTTIYPKILLQKTWESKLKWDEEVTSEIKTMFLKWFKELSYLADIEIPRWFSKNDVSKWTLHVFCDASQSAYATVIFLRAEISSSVTLYLVEAKSRVAPLKKLSIPRLELLAATIGARLASSVLKCFDLCDLETVFWSDSTTVISWIQREDRWTTFVWNRTQEIRKLTPKDAWRHVPGHLNPADLASRGCSPKELWQTKWWEGPSWLRQPKETWPSSNLKCDEADILKEKRKGVISSLMTTEKHENDWYHLYFSKFDKVTRLIGWIYRFKNNCCVTDKINGPLTTEELKKAELAVVKMIQQDCFFGEHDKKLENLCVVLDKNGVIRLKTKLTERPDSEYFISPLILPSKHPVVRILIYDYHVKYCHIGVQGLLCKLREKFWILNGRKTIRSVIGKCVICLRHKSKNFEAEPVWLPEARVRDATVFEVCGIDFAGPLFTNTKEKTYICLFTCAIYRAVHLELVSSLSTEEFILAIRRFIARRGRPVVIYSDNGTNFVGARNVLNQVNWEKINEYSTVERFEWRFNPPTAAWWGGWWERLVGLTKSFLRRTLGNALLSYEELYTVMCDCEAIINSRPLTYVSEDSNDLIPITPSMFLGAAKEFGTPDLDYVESIPSIMKRRLRFLQKLRDDLRHRFRNEYLGQLVLKPKKITRTIKKGEIVLVESENKKRLNWPLAIVEDIILGKDGNIRVVKLRTKSNILIRPIQKVYPLEVQDVSSDVLKTKSGRVTKQPSRYNAT